MGIFICSLKVFINGLLLTYLLFCLLLSFGFNVGGREPNCRSQQANYRGNKRDDLCQTAWSHRTTPPSNVR
jgi:hypothetical protein